MKKKIILIAVILIAVLLIFLFSTHIEEKREEKSEQTNSIRPVEDKPVVSINTHKRHEGWTVTVYAEDDRVFQYSGTVELGRPKEIILRIEEGGYAEDKTE